jgi:sensor histidine kinase YesM
MEIKVNLCCMWLNPRSKLIRIGIHILVWSLLFLFPYLMFPRMEHEFQPGFTHLATIIFYVIIFYSNYFILTDKLLFEKRFVWYCLINIILLLFFLWMNSLLHNWLRPKLPDFGTPKGMFPGKPADFSKLFVVKDLFSFFIPIIFAIALRAMERWIRTEAEKKEIVNNNLESELEHLRYQIQPHFFFNSLNNIYSLIAISPPKAQDTVLGLSQLMRYLLYETNHKKVDLAHEISFLTNYIQLMEIRQSEKNTTQYAFPNVKEKQYFIAPLLFITMIENAYKHGVSATQPSQIYFSIELKGNAVLFTSGNTSFPKNASDISGSGIGLDNLRKRLELVYPGKHALNIYTEKSTKDLFTNEEKEDPEKEVFWVRLRINPELV